MRQRLGECREVVELDDARELRQVDHLPEQSRTHNGAVVNGVLENLPPLPPGNYQIQLIVVGNDGNYVQPPYQVGFTVQ